uniref:paraquat-inducible protein A n=1 Tax=Thaumasiovibrio occultus TaxID=1891184 RepID=UPI000B36416A|nr:paraquat-inducible protein A [Thaumasiovibrio occultus]
MLLSLGCYTERMTEKGYASVANSADPSYQGIIKNASMNDDNIVQCGGCGLAVQLPPPSKKHSLHCPRCNNRLARSQLLAFSAEPALAIACLFALLPAVFLPLITINLFDVTIPATILNGTFALITDGFPLVGILVAFCAIVAPLLYANLILIVHVSLRWRLRGAFGFATHTLHWLKHWVMIDVYLVSLAISCFKVRDYADIQLGWSLVGLVASQAILIVLITLTKSDRYWHAWTLPDKPLPAPQPLSGAAINENPQFQANYRFATQEINHATAPHSDIVTNKKSSRDGKSQQQTSCLCRHCHLTQAIQPMQSVNPTQPRCQRCASPLFEIAPHSLQKTWALLIAATVFIFPANLYPISILMTNGQRLEDTIMSGVVSLVSSDMLFIAIIIFTASIVVPFAKIAILVYLLITVHLGSTRHQRLKMKLFHFVRWIGKWSVMDLFVIAIMMTLLDRGRLLDFTPGPGAIAFGVVVVLTMLAAESLDSRLLWKSYDRKFNPSSD